MARRGKCSLGWFYGFNVHLIIKDHEPRLALYAGDKGLDVYRRLSADAQTYLNPNGCVLVEIGYGQKEDVVKIFEEHGFAIHEVIRDYAGIERVVVGSIN